MAKILPTVKVVEKKTKIEMVINERDFNEELYELKDKTAKVAKKAEKKAEKADEKLDAELKALMGEK